MPFVEPTYTKGRVNRAGANARLQRATEEDLTVINTWRAAHNYVLNTFQATLRNRSRGMGVVVAQRLKRLRTIIGKLQRFPKMELARMNDIAGCRLIFGTVHELMEFRKAFHGARFNHRLRNNVDDYNYLDHPKEDGYRGVHDVYEYNVNSEGGKKWNGLLLEIQYRTIFQHAWATSVEVVGLITEHQPKFHVGDPRHLEFFRLASEIIARTCEAENSCYAELSDEDLEARFVSVEQEINVLRTLKGINAVNKEVLSGKNVILVFKEESELDILSFDNTNDALERYFRLERERGREDIVFVNAESGEDIRFAFRNYFSDTGDFVAYVEEGCKTLQRRTVRRRLRSKAAAQSKRA